MWNKLDQQKKKWIMWAAMLVLVYVAYRFSVQHTIAAFQLNAKLKKEQENVRAEDAAFPQLHKKSNFYLEALKAYKVKTEDRENRLWQAISGMAIGQQVKISFTPNLQTMSDTAGLQKEIVKQQFTFKGNYFNLVKLLDTMSKSSHIGQIAAVKLSNRKELNGQANKDGLNLQLELRNINK
jgi:hypothetical protein